MVGIRAGGAMPAAARVPKAYQIGGTFVMSCKAKVF